jgi:hypothetical protein
MDRKLRLSEFVQRLQQGGAQMPFGFECAGVATLRAQRVEDERPRREQQPFGLLLEILCNPRRVDGILIVLNRVRYLRGARPALRQQEYGAGNRR